MAGLSKPTIIDLFAGVGGLSLGFEEKGFDLIYANDNDKWASETFRTNHPNIPYSDKNLGDITAKEIKKIIDKRHVNVIVGGVPCQSFSMAGYRIRKSHHGQVDSRDYLFKHFMRIVDGLQPDIAIIENVKGILSADSGSIKEMIIRDFKKIGYEVSFKVLNAADYGAPQLRERVFFIANKRGVANEFPLPSLLPAAYVTVGQILRQVPKLNHEPRPLSGRVLERVKLIKVGKNWTSLPKELQTKSQHSGAYGRLDPNKPARTLTTRFDTPSVGYVTHPYQNRTLTVREGARIQGFPDNFVFVGPTMQQYKQVGNAVPVFFSRAIAGSVLEMMEKANSLSKKGAIDDRRIQAVSYAQG